MVAQTLLVLQPDRLGHRPRPAHGLPVRTRPACSAPGPAPSPTAATSARLLIIAQTAAMVQSFVLAAVVFAATATVGGRSTRSPPCRASSPPSTTRPAGPSSSRWCRAEELPNAVSLNSAVMTGSRVVRPRRWPASSWSRSGFGWAFLLDAVSYIAVIVRPLGDAHRRSSIVEPPTATAKGQVREGLRYVFAEPQLLVPLVMMAVIGTFAFNFSVTIPLLVKRTLGGDDATFTLLFSVLSLGSLVGALTTARRSTVDQPQPDRLVRRLRRGHAPAGRGPEPLGRLPRRHRPRLRQRRLPDLLDGHRPAPRRTRCTGGGCWPCRPWSSSAAPPSAGRSWGGSPTSAVLAPAWCVGGVACLAAALYGFQRAHGRRTDAAPRRGPDRRTGARRGRGPRRTEHRVWDA